MKEFAFRGLINCASCGSQITGEEKFKKLADGSRNRHVYYHCTRQVNYDCPQPYIRQELLEQELLIIIKSLSIEDVHVSEKLRYCLRQYKDMTKDLVLKQLKEDTRTQTQVFHSYAAYLIESGDEKQKAEFYSSLKLDLRLNNRQVVPYK